MSYSSLEHIKIPLKIRGDRLLYIGLVLVYRAVLDWLYMNSAAPIYGHALIETVSASFVINVLSYLSLLGLAAVMPIRGIKPSVLIVSFLFIITYVPSSSIAMMDGLPIPPLFWLTVAYAVFCLLARVNTNFRFKFSTRMTEKTVLIILIIFTVLSFAIMIAKYGIKVPTSIFDVYGVRDDYVDSLGSGKNIIEYLFGWQANVVNPFLIVWGLSRRNKTVFLIGVLLQLMIFGVAGQKSHFFALFFIIWMYGGIRYFYKSLPLYLVSSCIAIVPLMLAVDAVTDSYLFSATIANRIFFVPAQIYYYYYDFINGHVFTYMSQYTLFKELISYPYSLDLPHLMGHYYGASYEMSLNANMWGEAYASLGGAGMVLFAFLMKAFTTLLDGMSEGKNRYLTFGLIITPLLCLTNSSFLTTMVTHGFLLACIIIVMLPRTECAAA